MDVSFLFDIYATWTFPSANPDDRVVYFLGKADWSVRYDGDFKKVNSSVVYTAGTENRITDSAGFFLHNANERTEGPSANEQIGDTWVNP